MAQTEIPDSQAEIIDQLSDKLENIGYDVTRNAKLGGQSGAEHIFEILASRDNGFSLSDKCGIGAPYLLQVGADVLRQRPCGFRRQCLLQVIEFGHAHDNGRERLAAQAKA